MLVIISPAEAASLDITPSARAAHPHKAWRRHARVHTRVSYVDWYHFDPRCRPTGYPRPRGFCGGRDYYLGGVW